MSRLFPYVLLAVATSLGSASVEEPSPAPVHIVGMRYVAKARDVHIGGTVRLRCRLNDDGSVQDVAVISGHPIFVSEVVQNAREWRFTPATTSAGSGRTALLQYDFKLSGCTSSGQYKEQFTFDQPGVVTVTSEYPCWKPDIGSRATDVK